MQDVIELRLADRKLRREIAGPKTIANAKMQGMNSGPSGPMPGRRDDRSRNDNRRDSRKGPERGERGKKLFSSCKVYLN